MRKKINLLVLFVLLIPSIAESKGIYSFFNVLGSCADFVIAKGCLSKEDEEIFNDVAARLGIENREIKPRNSGFLLRLFTGYNNALAIQPLNRVYLNAACLKKMTEGQKRFLMGHELTHHSQNHVWKRMGVLIFKNIAEKKINQYKPAMNEYANKKLPKRLQSSKNSESPFVYRYFVEGWKAPLGLIEISAKGLAVAMFMQHQESEADQIGLEKSGASFEDARKMLDSLYYPDMSDWPLYAAFTHLCGRIMMPIFCLPVLKQHMPHLVSHKDRIAALQKYAQKINKRNKQKRLISA